MMSLRYAACVSIALGLSNFPAQAKFIFFQVPGATATEASVITNNGEVIGYFDDPSGPHGFIRAADGTFTVFDAPGATQTIPVAVNREGALVGYDTINGNSWKGFIRSPDGQFTDVVTPHGTLDTYALSLNNAGWIAGTGVRGTVHRHHSFGFLRDAGGHYSEFGNGLGIVCMNSHDTTAGSLFENNVSHGIVRTRDGKITQFDPPGAITTGVSAINDAGTVTGYSELSSGIIAGFIRASDGTISTFTIPGENVVRTDPASINKSGAIAGISANADYSVDGFIRAPDGTITTIDVPGAIYTFVNGINDKGQVVGTFDTNGIAMGFIWKP